MKNSLFIFAIALSFSIKAQFPMGGPGAGATKPKTAIIPGTFDDQAKGTGKITGYVIDSSATKAVEFANIGLFNKANGKPVDGTTADEKGKFTLHKIAKGEYKLMITFIGFKTYTVDNVTIEEKGSNLDLGVIRLAPSVQNLEEVTVTGQKALIEDKVDRLVYNAEKDQTSKGGDATDVLKKVPMLSVDLDGNVSLRGNSNVKVLINNKPSSIMASSVADALKQIPADMIKSVEVITSPSAKYDAEGSSGIINIITKKNTLQGLTLNIDSSVGIRGSNLGVSGNYRKGKMGFSLGGFGRANYNVKGKFENSQLTKATNGDRFLNLQTADTRSHEAFGQYRVGWDYDIDKKNTITASLRYGVRNQNRDQNLLKNQQFFNNTLIGTNTRNVNVKDESGSYDLNLDYTHTYDKPQREFSILTQVSRNNRTNDFVNNILDISNLNVANRIKNDNASFNQEITIQADYQTPISKNHIVEIGGKGILRQVSSDFKYFFAKGVDAPYIEVNNKLLGNVFDYDQNVIGTYTSLTSKLGKKYNSKVGVRYEYTDILAKFKDGSDLKIPAYGTVVPSVTLSRNIKGGSTIKASYNRRIQRPSLQFLNPNINAANPLSISYGNPTLDPEFTNNYEVTLNTFFKNTFMTVSAFARNTNNAIESLRDVIGKDTIRTTYANIGQQNAYGFNLFGNYNYKSKFQIGAGGDIYYADLKNNVSDPIYKSANSGWVGSFRAFGSYTMKKGWGLQMFSFYRGNQVQLQGKQGGFGIYSLSLKKDFTNKKGSIGIGAENFFTPTFKIKNEVSSILIDQKSVTTVQYLNFKVNFSYRIGKMSLTAPTKRKKSVNNDDLKEGGDGGGGQPAPQAAPAGGAPAQRGPR
jgi:outer membrane receptor protein involved in Fe transport